MYLVFAVNPAVSCKNRTSQSEFPDYSGHSSGKMLKCMGILQIVPNIQNPLQGTAEILEY